MQRNVSTEPPLESNAAQIRMLQYTQATSNEYSRNKNGFTEVVSFQNKNIIAYSSIKKRVLWRCAVCSGTNQQHTDTLRRTDFAFYVDLMWFDSNRLNRHSLYCARGTVYVLDQIHCRKWIERKKGTFKRLHDK